MVDTTTERTNPKAEAGDPEREDMDDAEIPGNDKLPEEAAAHSSALQKGWKWMDSHIRLPPRYRLVTEQDALTKSLWSVQFAILTSAINTKMLNPNYPIMVAGEDAHEDAFPSTEPFDFNSATYFLPMCSLIGVAFASIFLGQLSDRLGRKKIIWALAVISGVGSIVKFFTRQTFWGFCASQFVFGFFLGNLPVGMAYIGDVFVTQREKELQLGKLVSFFVIGNAGGGVIAILMNGSGLFAPLWIGAGLMFVSAAVTSMWMIEPGDMKVKSISADDDEQLALLGNETKNGDNEEGQANATDSDGRPDTIDQKSLWNIVGGAVADNFGSTGLFPLCLSPLALEQYTLDFIQAGEDPLMSIEGYQWLSVMVAVMVVPSTLMTPWAFRKFGVAGTCVLGNSFTAVVTGALLLIGNGPATSAAFGGFVAVLYCGFPFTVFSQRTTGPMLDAIAPIDKIGFVQGLNNAAMNFGMAVAPWLFGLLADGTTTNIAIITGIAVSLLAAMINTPLMFNPKFGKNKSSEDAKDELIARRQLPGEDSEVFRLAMEGATIPAELVYAVNKQRFEKGQMALVPHVRPYEDDKKGHLRQIRDHAAETYRFREDMIDQLLLQVNDPNSERSNDEICLLLNNAYYGSKEDEGQQTLVRNTTRDVGDWIGEYLLDSGYNPHVNSIMIKQMVLSAFPPISSDSEYTPENLEAALLRFRRTMQRYLRNLEEDSPDARGRWNHTLQHILGNGATQVYYS